MANTKGKQAKEKETIVDLQEEKDIASEDLIDENDDEAILMGAFKEVEKIIQKKVKKTQGRKEISQEDVLDVVNNYDFSIDQIDQLRSYLIDKGYTLIDEEDDDGEEDLDMITEDELIQAEKEAEEDEEENFEEEENIAKEEIASIEDFSKIQSGEVKVNDSVKMYLKEIGKVDLLTAKQETELAQRIVKGEEATKELKEIHAKYVEEGGELADYNAWLDSINFRHPDKELFAKKCVAADGKAAKDNLITANLRLVIAIAKHYVGRGMHFLDLIQEGNMGLIKAVEKFDYTKGFKFSTYATWWIRQAITRAIADQARTIRIPVHMVETINKMTRVQRQLVQEYGRDPTAEEISEAMEGALTPEKIREIQRIALEPVSLETPIGEEDDSHLGDFIEDKDAQSPEEFTSRSLLKEELYGIMRDLTPREEQVLKLRYGLEDGHPRTLEEVGKEFGVTRERIRQIEAKAIRKLRHPTRAKRLGDYKDCVTMTGPDTHK